MKERGEAMGTLVRSAALRLFFAVVLALVATATRAHASRGGAAPEAGPAADSLVVHAAGALFTPSRVDGGLEWRARWVLPPEAAEDIARGKTRLLRFATPLSDMETLEPTFGVGPFAEGGQVVGIIIDRAGTDGRVVTAVVRQRLADAGTRGLRLGAPVAAGPALQIIDADLGGAATLELDVGAGFERHVGYVTPAGVSGSARAEARRLTGYDVRVNGAAVYVRGEDLTLARGLVARVVTPRERGSGGAIGVAVLFAALVLALLAAVRKLRHAASVERADAILAAELDALGGSGPGAAGMWRGSGRGAARMWRGSHEEPR